MVIKTKNLSLKQIADSGQCFRWKELEPGSYEIPIGKGIIWAEQLGEDEINASVRNGIVTSREIHNYFDLDTDYQAIIDRIPEDDTYLRTAAEKFSGIRILRQDLWEMVVSFIISQNNNIPRIKKSIESMCGDVGHFPSVEKLKKIDLSTYKLGYRQQYLKAVANLWQGRDSENFSRNTSYLRFKEHLMTYCGIGDKVADCICLFGLHHLEACPIDTWMKKIIDTRYGGVKPEWMSGKYAGVYQQHCFAYERSLGL